jgi:biotin-(acetyl-CoA carboxylase) ligase
LVIGIGINTNFDKSELKDITNSATFMSETSRKVDNYKLMEDIVEEIIQNFNELVEKGPEGILMFFKENMAFLEEKRYVSAINKEAIIRGVSDKGYLLIEDDGEEKEIFFGMI